MKECLFEKYIYAGKRYGTSFYLLPSDLLAHLVTNFHAGEQVSQDSPTVLSMVYRWEQSSDD